MPRASGTDSRRPRSSCGAASSSCWSGSPRNRSWPDSTSATSDGTSRSSSTISSTRETEPRTAANGSRSTRSSWAVGWPACTPSSTSPLSGVCRSWTRDRERGPARLVELGCAFDRTADGSFDLIREGGQSVPRSVHAADATGRELMRVARRHARTRAERLVGVAVDLLVAEGQCGGAVVASADGAFTVSARTTLLATGGCGALYEATTNTAASTGDGVALAYLS